jgi:hypothetical protein
MRTALLVALFLVVVPAGVFAYAKSQPSAPLTVPPGVVKQRIEQQLLGQGYTYVSCTVNTAPGKPASFMCSGSKGGSAYSDITAYVLVGSDSR